MAKKRPTYPLFDCPQSFRTKSMDKKEEGCVMKCAEKYVKLTQVCPARAAFRNTDSHLVFDPPPSFCAHRSASASASPRTRRRPPPASNDRQQPEQDAVLRGSLSTSGVSDVMPGACLRKPYRKLSSDTSNSFDSLTGHGTGARARVSLKSICRCQM